MTSPAHSTMKTTSVGSLLAVFLLLVSWTTTSVHAISKNGASSRVVSSNGRPWGLSSLFGSDNNRKLPLSVADVRRGGGAPDQAATDAALQKDAKITEPDEVEELYLPGLLDVRIAKYEGVRVCVCVFRFVASSFLHRCRNEKKGSIVAIMAKTASWLGAF